MRFKSLAFIFLICLTLSFALRDPNVEVIKVRLSLPCQILHYTFVFSYQHLNNESTELAPEKDSRLLLFATLGGTLVAVRQQTGRIQWKIQDSNDFIDVSLKHVNLIFSFRTCC